MLENLRAMAVFSSVVRQGSFSGAAKELGITTSAVSQQIRALEQDVGVVLLHRSTRKLSLTEAGDSFYQSAKQMVKFAEEAKDNVSRFRDELLGSLRIATTPKLAEEHILPALSHWLNKHSDLSLQLFTDNGSMDMIDERLDLAVNFSLPTEEVGVPLAKVPQLLLASKSYLNKLNNSNEESYSYIKIDSHNHDDLVISANGNSLRPAPRFSTNDIKLGLSMACQDYGVIKTNALDAKEYLKTGQLVQVPHSTPLPMLVLHAKTLGKDNQPAKVWRCLEVLTEYFSVQTQIRN